MKPADIAKAILEANFEDDFDPVDYVKFGGNESAIEIYNGPLVRIIQPLTVYTLNDHFYKGVDWDDTTFQAILQNGPVYVIDNKEGDGDEMAAVQPNTQKCWNAQGQERPWSDLPEIVSAKGDAERKNWQDAQQGLATYFMSQIAKKKQVGQYVKALSVIGRNDLAVNYARYLGRAKLPFGKSIDAVLAMKKAGKRSRNRIARLMKNQRDVKWGERGFWLLFNDWSDLSKFYDKDRQHDYQKAAEAVFGGDTSEWFDSADSKPEEVWSSLDDKSMHIIKHLLVNRTVYNTDGEEHLVTKEDIAELTDDEVKDIVCDRGNKNDSTEDIYDAVHFGANDAYRYSMEGAYYQGYQQALIKLYGLQEDKTLKWIKADGKEKLGMWFPYSTLEEWMNQWKEDEYDDEFFGSIHDLAERYLEKVQPNNEYYGDMDSDEFNEQVQYHLNELEMTVPDNSDPNQPELPMSGESDPKAPEIPGTTTVAIGNNYTDQQQRTYKGVDSEEAHKYHKAMGGKVGDQDIHLRAEAFLAVPLSRIDESASDVKIEFTASEEAAESVVPLLKELQKMGQQGSSRRIKIEDWDGKSDFDFDGDGASKIGDITVAGKVIEALVNGDDEDPKEFLNRHHDISLPERDEVDYDVYPVDEHVDFHGHFASDEPELDRQNEEWIERQLEMGNQWAWCTARVRATWTDPVTEETFHGYDYLGCCSYKNEKDFCHPEGYYPQMKEAAYDDLVKNITKRQSSLGESESDDIDPKMLMNRPTNELLLQEAVYKYATTQIDMPKGIAQHIIQWGELNIADADLYIDEKDGCGRETEQHVTVLYGLLAQQPPEELRQIVIHTKPFLIELAGISIFENEKYDVVKINVISEELSNLHYELRRSCPNENKYPDYKPHVTIAYVKKGLGKKYEGMDVFKAATQPRDFWAYELKFKGAGDSESAERVVELIPFDKSKDFEPKEEPVAGEARYPEAVGESEDPKDFADEIKPFKTWKFRVRGVDGGRMFQVFYLDQPVGEMYMGRRGVPYIHRYRDYLVNQITEKEALSPFDPERFSTVWDWLDGVNESEDPKEFIDDMRYRLKRGNEYFWRGGGQAGWTRDPLGATPLAIEDAQRIADGIVRTTPGAAPRDFITEPINDPNNLGENDQSVEDTGGEVTEDPKDFLAAYLVRIRCGRGAQTKYLYQAPNGFSYTWTPDMDRATVFDQDRANEIVDNLFPGGKYVSEPVATEVVESAEEDAKDYALTTEPTGEPVPVGEVNGVPLFSGRAAYKTFMRRYGIPNQDCLGRHGPFSCDCPVLFVDDYNNGKPMAYVQLQESEEDPKDYVEEIPPALYVVAYNERHGQQLYWDAAVARWTQSLQKATGYDFEGAEEIAQKFKDANPQSAHLFEPYMVPDDSVQETLNGPFDDDGLPGEVTSFLRLQRGRANKARKAQTGRSVL